MRKPKNILKCGIEQAYFDGKTTFRKPVSCHLYPIRITQYDHYEALNYDRWGICSAACTLGDKLGVPVYKFLKEALIRKYGATWYQSLVAEIESESWVWEKWCWYQVDTSWYFPDLSYEF